MTRKRDVLRTSGTQVRWCDDERVRDENAGDVAPGGYLNRFGWYVVGTTIGGNAIVVSATDEGVYFAGHDWYRDDDVSYKALADDGRWIDGPLTAETVRASLFRLASSVEEWVRRVAEIDTVLDAVD